MTLSRKILFVTIGMLFLISLVLTGISYQKLNNQTWASLTESTINANEFYAGSMGEWFRSKRTATAALAAAITKNQDSENILRHLQQAKDGNEFDTTYLGTINGDMYRETGLNTVAGFDPRTRSWYQLGIQNRNIVETEPFISAGTGQLNVTIAQRIEVNNQVLGVVGVGLGLARINQEIVSMKIPGNGFAFLVSDKGIVVSHPEEKLRNTAFSEMNTSMNLPDVLNAGQRELVTQVFNGKEYLVAVSKVPDSNFYLVMAGNKDILLQPVRDLLMFMLVVAVVIILISVAVMSFVIRILLANLGSVSSALKEISEGGGDLTRRIVVSGKDEVAMLANNFNDFTDHLRQLLVNVEGVTRNLTAQAGSASTSAEQRAQQARAQQDEVTLVATAVTEMTSATLEIARNAEQAAHTSTESVSLSEKGQQLSGTCEQSIHQLATEVNQATAVIDQLAQQGQQINTIVATIRSIAEQTNLLALNAAIEAARAGDQGRGFAVVADEVRVLSQRTHKSTEEISSMITVFQSMTGQAVSSMENCHKLTQNSVADVANASQSFKDIAVAIKGINDMAAYIATAAEEQTSVTDEIGRNTDAIRNVAVEFLNESMEGTRQAVQLQQLATELDTLLRQFKLH